jgi:hypothetical protein
MDRARLTIRRTAALQTSCFWTDRHQEAIRVNDIMLAQPNLPENFRQSDPNRQLSWDIRLKSNSALTTTVKFPLVRCLD